MRYVGKRSLSSVLAAILTAVWVFMWISLIGMVGFGIHSLVTESGANQMAVLSHSQFSGHHCVYVA